jgi:hypothetical protein
MEQFDEGTDIKKSRCAIPLTRAERTQAKISISERLLASIDNICTSTFARSMLSFMGNIQSMIQRVNR